MGFPRYFSTRDPQTCLVSFEEALLRGLAPDGGLYVPDHVPAVGDAWRSATSLPDLGRRVLGRWLAGEVGEDALAAILDEALDFPVPLVPLSDRLWVLELFHGPTLSFKDVGARTMARLMNHFLTRRGERRVILVATSGDTGSAVADGFAGLDNLEVVLLYPEGMVSEVQERQLVHERPGVRAFAVQGSFDDCQRLVKEAFVAPELAQLPLSSANSINIGRLLPQSLYYFWAVRQLGGMEPLLPPLAGDGEVVFCVPSGNLGNVTGGMLAQRMGLPAGRFVAAHNANDYFPDFLGQRAGAYAFRATVRTLSNAMDVGAPSNFERLHGLLSPEEFAEAFWGTSVSDDTTRERMRRTYQQAGYLACPHTAVGLEAAARYRAESGDDRPLIVLATAHPAKFPRVVADAVGAPAPIHEKLERLAGPPAAVPRLEPTLGALQDVLL